MFSGIVTAQGTVGALDRDGERLTLSIEGPFSDIEPGESVAVNGACLTVVDRGDGWFRVEAISTTRGRTRLDEMELGERVNLERALKVGERLGGHFVQGHVDGLGEVIRVGAEGDALLVDIRVSSDDVADVSVLHGSIAVDGVSLTINALPGPGIIQVALIPYTREQTTLGDVRPGDRVHLEGDMIGKFVRQLVQTHEV